VGKIGFESTQAQVHQFYRLAQLPVSAAYPEHMFEGAL